MHFLRKIKPFNICSKIVKMFYDTTIASVIQYEVICSINGRNKTKRPKIPKRAQSTIEEPPSRFDTTWKNRGLRKSEAIVTNHP
ncbi:hypothetical protein GDO81_028250 [Engystomops pustulosus]|uniref:Uncharacterized protein n=1 Tax=Engystomops pustulosus TaxID=76066 RepID=A0AAV6ZNY2_ENGPU|nr:hypothetical protein GDO81_028250 [Engystomops pustulosus]